MGDVKVLGVGQSWELTDDMSLAEALCTERLVNGSVPGGGLLM